VAERTHSVRLRLEIDQLRRDAAGATQAIGGIGAAAKDTGAQSAAMAALGTAARGVGQTLAAVGTVAAGSMVALGAATIATGVSYNSLEQNTRAALTTLLGGAQAATAQMDELRQFVRTALFPREVFIQGQQQLLSFGLAAERVIPVLDAVQNAVAATGGSAQRFSEVVEILAEMQSTGEITAGTLNELGRRGINAAQLIGSAMGQTENDIRDSITTGALDGRTAIELLVTAMETRFAGAAALISNTWVGASGLVTAALRDIGSAAVEPFIDPAGGGAAVVWAQNLAQVLYALERQIRSVVGTFRDAADPALERFGDQLLGVADAIDGFDIDGMLDRLRGGGPALAGLGAAAAAAGGQAALGAVGMGSLAGAINPLGAAITAAVIASPELRELLFDLFEALQPLLPLLLDTGATLATVVTTGLATVAELLQPLVPLVEAIVDVFTALPGPLQQATVAVIAFGLALRFGGPVGAAITALAVLGAVVETLKGAFGDGDRAAQEWRSTLAETVTDLERLAKTGRASGDLIQLRAIFEDLDDALESTGDGLNFLERELASAGSTFDDVFGDVPNFLTSPLTAWSRSLETTGEKLDEFRSKLEPTDKALAQMVASGDVDLAGRAFEELARRAELAGVSQEELLELLPEYGRQMQRHAEATDSGADGQRGFQGAVEDATGALREQADALRAQVDPAFALFDALRDVRSAQEEYNGAVGEFGSNSPEATQAARDLFEATVDLQGAAGDASGAFDGRLTPAMRDALEAANLTETQIAAMEAVLRDTKDALDDYEGRYEAEVGLRGAKEAEAAAKRIKARLAEIDRQVTINFEVTGQAPVGATRLARQHGGPIETGPSGVDRVPALLTRGEHVWTVREVQAAGGHAGVEALRAAVLGHATQFAVGGAVGVPRMRAGGAVAGQTLAGGRFSGNLYLDSGTFLGVVDGRIDAHDRDLDRMVTQGTGAAR
jgi:tape measure domain-containing protein